MVAITRTQRNKSSSDRGAVSVSIVVAVVLSSGVSFIQHQHHMLAGHPM